MGNPCGSGTCVATGATTYSCNCPNGYGGAGCLGISFLFFSFFLVNSILDIFIQFRLFLSIDLNECILGTQNCHTQATCNNTIGSFTCKCNSGYSGNGVSCTGILYFSFFFLPNMKTIK